MPGRRRREGIPCRPRWKRGLRLVLRPSLLLMLAEHDSHGYELMEQLTTLGFDNECLDSSVIYRDLRDMEEMGFIRSFWDEEDSKGPKRRVYQIKEQGWERLEDWLEGLDQLREQITDLSARYQKLKGVKGKS